MQAGCGGICPRLIPACRYAALRGSAVRLCPAHFFGADGFAPGLAGFLRSYSRSLRSAATAPSPARGGAASEAVRGLASRAAHAELCACAAMYPGHAVPHSNAAHDLVRGCPPLT